VSNPDEILHESSRFRVVRRKQQPSGKAMLSRDVILHPGAVVIIPRFDDRLLRDGGRIYLIRNYRVAVDETLIELPAGTLEPNEDPLECAHRELEEETGYRAAKIEKLHEFYMSPGILNERMHLFLATGLTPGEMNLDEGEQIEVVPTPWNDALTMIDTGEIRDAKTIAGLLFYDRHRR